MSKARLIGPAGMGGVTALRGASSVITSMQRNTIELGGASTTGTGVLVPVDTTRTVLRWLGVNGNWTLLGLQYEQVRIALTDATTVTATRFAAGGLAARVGWELTEYAPGVIKSIQNRTITIASGNASQVDTVTAVDPNKSQLVWLGESTDATSDDNGYALTELTNATTVTANRRGTGAFAVVVSYQIVEWF